MTDTTHPVDELLPAPKLFTLGLQHVLVMYAGAITVPLMARSPEKPPATGAFCIGAARVCG
ncbi:MAG: solute carrier family 23 protein [Pseudorhodobacter sp.]|nr:solute carrier family 23 protein [Pseudorhodobacter sp.]